MNVLCLFVHKYNQSSSAFSPNASRVDAVTCHRSQTRIPLPFSPSLRAPSSHPGFLCLWEGVKLANGAGVRTSFSSFRSEVPRFDHRGLICRVLRLLALAFDAVSQALLSIQAGFLQFSGLPHTSFTQHSTLVSLAVCKLLWAEYIATW